MDVLTAEPVGQRFGFDPENKSFLAFDNGAADRKLLFGCGFAQHDMVIGEEDRASWEAVTASNSVMRW